MLKTPTIEVDDSNNMLLDEFIVTATQSRTRYHTYYMQFSKYVG